MTKYSVIRETIMESGIGHKEALAKAKAMRKQTEIFDTCTYTVRPEK